MGRPSSLSVATSYKDCIVGNYSSADVMQLCRSAKQRSELKSVPFAGLESLYIHTLNELTRNGGVCECCKAGFRKNTTGKGGGGKYSLSLHRVIAAKGYVPENVKVICQGCNGAIGEIHSLNDVAERMAALHWQQKILTQGD